MKNSISNPQAAATLNSTRAIKPSLLTFTGIYENASLLQLKKLVDSIDKNGDSILSREEFLSNYGVLFPDNHNYQTKNLAVSIARAIVKQAEKHKRYSVYQHNKLYRKKFSQIQSNNHNNGENHGNNDSKNKPTHFNVNVRATVASLKAKTATLGRERAQTFVPRANPGFNTLKSLNISVELAEKLTRSEEKTALLLNWPNSTENSAEIITDLSSPRSNATNHVASVKSQIDRLNRKIATNARRVSKYHSVHNLINSNENLNNKQQEKGESQQHLGPALFYGFNKRNSRISPAYSLMNITGVPQIQQHSPTIPESTTEESTTALEREEKIQISPPNAASSANFSSKTLNVPTPLSPANDRGSFSGLDSSVKNSINHSLFSSDLDSYCRGVLSFDELVALQHFRLMKTKSPNEIQWSELITAICLDNPQQFLPHTVLSYLERQFSDLDREKIGVINKQQWEHKFGEASWRAFEHINLSGASTSNENNSGEVSNAGTNRPSQQSGTLGGEVSLDSFVQYGISLYVGKKYNYFGENKAPPATSNSNNNNNGSAGSTPSLNNRSIATTINTTPASTVPTRPSSSSLSTDPSTAAAAVSVSLLSSARPKALSIDSLSDSEFSSIFSQYGVSASAGPSHASSANSSRRNSDNFPLLLCQAVNNGEFSAPPKPALSLIQCEILLREAGLAYGSGPSIPGQNNATSAAVTELVAITDQSIEWNSVIPSSTQPIQVRNTVQARIQNFNSMAVAAPAPIERSYTMPAQKRTENSTDSDKEPPIKVNSSVFGKLSDLQARGAEFSDVTQLFAAIKLFSLPNFAGFDINQLQIECMKLKLSTNLTKLVVNQREEVVKHATEQANLRQLEQNTPSVINLDSSRVESLSPPKSTRNKRNSNVLSKDDLVAAYSSVIRSDQQRRNKEKKWEARENWLIREKQSQNSSDNDEINRIRALLKAINLCNLIVSTQTSRKITVRLEELTVLLGELKINIHLMDFSHIAALEIEGCSFPNLKSLLSALKLLSFALEIDFSSLQRQLDEPSNEFQGQTKQYILITATNYTKNTQSKIEILSKFIQSSAQNKDHRLHAIEREINEIIVENDIDINEIQLSSADLAEFNTENFNTNKQLITAICITYCDNIEIEEIPIICEQNKITQPKTVQFLQQIKQKHLKNKKRQLRIERKLERNEQPIELQLEQLASALNSYELIDNPVDLSATQVSELISSMEIDIQQLDIDELNELQAAEIQFDSPQQVLTALSLLQNDYTDDEVQLQLEINNFQPKTVRWILERSIEYKTFHQEWLDYKQNVTKNSEKKAKRVVLEGELQYEEDFEMEELHSTVQLAALSISDLTTAINECELVASSAVFSDEQIAELVLQHHIDLSLLSIEELECLAQHQIEFPDEKQLLLALYLLTAPLTQQQISIHCLKAGINSKNSSYIVLNNINNRKSRDKKPPMRPKSIPKTAIIERNIDPQLSSTLENQRHNEIRQKPLAKTTTFEESYVQDELFAALVDNQEVSSAAKQPPPIPLNCRPRSLTDYPQGNAATMIPPPLPFISSPSYVQGLESQLTSLLRAVNSTGLVKLKASSLPPPLSLQSGVSAPALMNYSTARQQLTGQINRSLDWSSLDLEKLALRVGYLKELHEETASEFQFDSPAHVIHALFTEPYKSAVDRREKEIASRPLITAAGTSGQQTFANSKKPLIIHTQPNSMQSSQIISPISPAAHSCFICSPNNAPHSARTPSIESNSAHHVDSHPSQSANPNSGGGNKCLLM
jgi:hypothetical protein